MDRLIDRKKTPPPEPRRTPTEGHKDDSALPETLHPQPAGPADSGSERDDSLRNLLEKPPPAPEDALEAQPPTKDTIEPTKVEKMPTPVPAVPTKPGLKALTLDTLPVPQAAAEEKWPPLAKRGGPEIIPPPELEPEFDQEPPKSTELAQQTPTAPVEETPGEPPSDQTDAPGHGTTAPGTRIAAQPDRAAQGSVQEPVAARTPDQPETNPAQTEVPSVEAPVSTPAEPQQTALTENPPGKPLDLKARNLPPGYRKGQPAARATSIPGAAVAVQAEPPSAPEETQAELTVHKPVEPDPNRPRDLPPGYLKKLAAQSATQPAAEPFEDPMEPPEKDDTPKSSTKSYSEPGDRGPERQVAALPPGPHVPEEPREMEPPTSPEPTPVPTSKPEASPVPPAEPEVQPPDEPVAPPKPEVPSPLDQEAPRGREVRKYLAATAPILEELSMLMARSPGLSIEDYDPSEPTASVGSKDLLIKMEAMKRDLQILDAKTFSILPPFKYTQFHLRIRESITETLQACDSIIAYLGKRESQYVKKAVDHLSRARDLIRDTR